MALPFGRLRPIREIIVDHSTRKLNRLRIMQAIFEASKASEYEIVATGPIGSALGLTDQELGDACKYLEGEGLIEGIHTLGSMAPLHVRITHWGIKEMEQSVDSPQEPTEHFPPAVSVINIHGSVIGSPIQSGSPGAQQTASTGDISLEVEKVSEFLGAYEERAAELGLAKEHEAEARAEIATIRAQIASPRPKRNVLQGSLVTIQHILEHAGGGVAASYLLELLQHIHF